MKVSIKKKDMQSTMGEKTIKNNPCILVLFYITNEVHYFIN